MQTVLDIIREFDTVIDDAVGLYLDAKSAMVQYVNFLTQTQTKSASQLGIPIEQFASRSFTYGRGDPNDPQSLDLHSTTQGNLKARNAKGGRNHLLLGQFFIVDLYSAWDDGYRPRIAASLHREKDSIQSDVFGDIRRMRRSIIHHRGVAVSDIRKCKILTWFRPGDIIDISDDARFHSIITEIRKWLEAFGLDAGGSSPRLLARYGSSGHRKI